MMSSQIDNNTLGVNEDSAMTKCYYAEQTRTDLNSIRRQRFR